MATQQIKQITHQIRKRREELQYSQEYMAFKMQMGQNCYSKIELGNNKLTVRRLLQICALLDINAGALINDSDEQTTLFTSYKKQA